MSIYELTDSEIAKKLASDIKNWRISERGAGITQAELSEKSGIGLTPLRRFEKTGGTTLKNLIAMLRALDLLERLEDLIPNPDTPSPMELLNAQKKKLMRKRAPRSIK